MILWWGASELTASGFAVGTPWAMKVANHRGVANLAVNDGKDFYVSPAGGTLSRLWGYSAAGGGTGTNTVAIYTRAISRQEYFDEFGVPRGSKNVWAAAVQTALKYTVAQAGRLGGSNLVDIVPVNRGDLIFCAVVKAGSVGSSDWGIPAFSCEFTAH